jgi:hypothetical protein
METGTMPGLWAGTPFVNGGDLAGVTPALPGGLNTLKRGQRTKGCGAAGNEPSTLNLLVRLGMKSPLDRI